MSTCQVCTGSTSYMACCRLFKFICAVRDFTWQSWVASFLLYDAFECQSQLP